MADETPNPDAKVEKQNLGQIIEAAATKVTEDTPKDEVKEVTKEVTKESPKDEKETKDELDAEQLKVATTLFKALNSSDPSIQKQTLRILAGAAGLDLKEIETKADVKEAKEATLLELLREGLGEYDFLADKLGPVLEKAFNSIIEKNTKDIRDEIKQTREEKVRTEINSAIDSAFAKFDNAVEVKDEVVKLMDSFPHTGKISKQEYFEKLIKLAASEKGLSLKSAGSKKEELDPAKVAKNRLDAASRLASERGAEVKTGVRTPGKMNLTDAVADAAQKALEKMNS